MIRPANIYWYKSVLNDFENRDKKFVAHGMKTIVKVEIEATPLGVSKSRVAVGWNSYNSGTPCVDPDDNTYLKNK